MKQSMRTLQEQARQYKASCDAEVTKKNQALTDEVDNLYAELCSSQNALDASKTKFLSAEQLHQQELTELEKLAPRLTEYLELWEEKNDDQFAQHEDEETRSITSGSLKTQFLE